MVSLKNDPICTKNLLVQRNGILHKPKLDALGPG